ncbi:MAG: CPXCG motif-containing cysteine-rich protein [Gammaproteobacteria bacterium]|nr:CPXCG motif-containing cysteine-rich protein [Gammaproteobacteria bacterium]
MNELETRKIQCPYCGETIDVLIDCSIPDQSYIEDCQVCCRPINFDVSVDQNENISILVTNENE